jgi:nucleoid-associated protein YgaU
MRKEFKIGMFLGLALVIIGVIYLSTRKSVTVESRTLEQTQYIAGPNLPSGEPNALAVSDANVRDTIASVLDQNSVSVPVATTSADLTKFEQTEPIKTQRFYIVHSGDTLSGISQKYYHTVKNVNKIYEANRNVITNKNRLKPGMKLVIPE